jgi:hypothetical protein
MPTGIGKIPGLASSGSTRAMFDKLNEFMLQHTEALTGLPVPRHMAGWPGRRRPGDREVMAAIAFVATFGCT